MRKIEVFAKKTFLAFQNPFHSVERVFPNVIDALEDGMGAYMGMKDSPVIPISFIERLHGAGIYLHTIDRAAVGGRAIDVQLKNPFTGRPMTGSSSGTAINVLLGINDIGLGTDGGGSVLAPAMSLNLCGFISPLLGAEHFSNRGTKTSTDGLSFTPSLGFITKEYGLLEKAVSFALSLEEEPEKKELRVEVVEGSDKFKKSRPELMEDLKARMEGADIVISKEGPIDVHGLGDTVLGHYDTSTRADQIMGAKGYLRVVNMLGYTGLSIPAHEFASGLLFICKSNRTDIRNMISFAKSSLTQADALSEYYFANINAYFETGANVSKK